MPQSRERKLEYNRERQRRKRLAASLKLASAPNSPTPLMLSPQIQKHRNVVPSIVLDVVPPRREKPYSEALVQGMTWDKIKDAAHLELKALARRRKKPADRRQDYILELNARGLTLTSVPPYRFVCMATGEISPTAPRTQEKPQKAIHAEYRAIRQFSALHRESELEESRRLRDAQVLRRLALLEADLVLHEATHRGSMGTIPERQEET